MKKNLIRLTLGSAAVSTALGVSQLFIQTHSHHHHLKGSLLQAALYIGLFSLVSLAASFFLNSSKNKLKFKVGDKLKYIKTGGSGGENDDILTVIEIGEYNYVIESEYRRDIIVSPFDIAESFLRKN